MDIKTLNDATEIRKQALWHDFAMESKVKIKNKGLNTNFLLNKNYSYHRCREISKLVCTI